MIIDHLRNEKSPQHISRLAQTCKWFHREANRFVYHPVKFVERENALRFAAEIEARPGLKDMIKEIRHYADMGFHDFFFYSRPFYKQLSTLQNLQTLVMRPKTHWKRQATWLERWESLYHDIYMNPGMGTWEDELWQMSIGMHEEGFPGRFSHDPFGTGACPWAEDISSYQGDLVDRTLFCDNYLKDSLPALRTCKSSATAILPILIWFYMTQVISDIVPYEDPELRRSIIRYSTCHNSKHFA